MKEHPGVYGGVNSPRQQPAEAASFLAKQLTSLETLRSASDGGWPVAPGAMEGLVDVRSSVLCLQAAHGWSFWNWTWVWPITFTSRGPGETCWHRWLVSRRAAWARSTGPTGQNYAQQRLHSRPSQPPMLKNQV